MARIIDITSPTVKMVRRTELYEHQVKLTAEERRILEQAQVICDKASELQAKINLGEHIPEEYNDFGWAEIYLRAILE